MIIFYTYNELDDDLLYICCSNVVHKRSMSCYGVSVCEPMLLVLHIRQSSTEISKIDPVMKSVYVLENLI